MHGRLGVGGRHAVGHERAAVGQPRQKAGYPTKGGVSYQGGVLERTVVRQCGLWAAYGRYRGVRSELLGDWECGGSFWSAILAVQEALKSGPGGLGGAKICAARSARG